MTGSGYPDAVSIFAAAAILGVVGAVLMFTARSGSGKPRSLSRRLGLGLLWLWVCGVAGLTFGTRATGGKALNVAPLNVSNSVDVVDFVLNVILFVPGGVLLVMLGLRWFQAAALGLLGSLGIEAVQYLSGSGRTADVNDVVSNTLGCLLGAIATEAATFRRHTSRLTAPPARARLADRE